MYIVGVSSGLRQGSGIPKSEKRDLKFLFWGVADPFYLCTGVVCRKWVSRVAVSGWSRFLFFRE